MVLSGKPICIREKKPVVHCVTNFVAMEITANVLLALGASPIMAHDLRELHDIVNISDSILLNQGTLSESWCRSIKTTLNYAKIQGKPVVFDPVGAGASKLRTNFAREILSQGGVSILKGNSSEILALAGQNIHMSKGVDSLYGSREGLSAARHLALTYNVVVCITGEVDLITDGMRVVENRMGSKVMTTATGMGCALGGVIAAYLSAANHVFDATAQAVYLFGFVAEKVGQLTQKPGSFTVAFLDALADDHTFHFRLDQDV